MNKIKRLTKALNSVITNLFGGRNLPSMGDSQTPFDDNITNITNAHYSHRYGWHLKNYSVPQKSVDGKALKSNENVQYRVCMVSYKPPVYKGAKNAEK